jgi:group I intron endonuclease
MQQNYRGYKNPMLGDLTFQSGVYKCIIGDKLYIGFSKNMRSRCQNHLSSLIHGNHDNWRLQEAWDKYHQAFFEVVELTTDLDREVYWTDYFNSNDSNFGYNISRGLKLSDETKCKLRLYTHSEESKIKISQASKGRKHSNETKIKISKGNKGKIVSEETRQKMRESWITRKGENK